MELAALMKQVPLINLVSAHGTSGPGSDGPATGSELEKRGGTCGLCGCNLAGLPPDCPPIRADQHFSYFQFRDFPSASHSSVVASRLALVSSRFASVIH